VVAHHDEQDLRQTPMRKIRVEIVGRQTTVCNNFSTCWIRNALFAPSTSVKFCISGLREGLEPKEMEHFLYIFEVFYKAFFLRASSQATCSTCGRYSFGIQQ